MINDMLVFIYRSFLIINYASLIINHCSILHHNNHLKTLETLKF